MKWAQSRSILRALWKESDGVSVSVYYVRVSPWQIWWEVARREDGARVQWWAPSWANTYYHHFNWRLVGGFSRRVCGEADSSGCCEHSLWAWLCVLNISLKICLCSMLRKKKKTSFFLYLTPSLFTYVEKKNVDTLERNDNFNEFALWWSHRQYSSTGFLRRWQKWVRSWVGK